MDKYRILIAEDNSDLRELYVDVLLKEGYSVETAPDGESALEKMRNGGYNLVLLDIFMPKMDGLSVMREIKKNPPQHPNKHVVFITNIDVNAEIKPALELGDGCLIKSQVTPGNLVEEVKAYLDKDKLA